MIDVNTLANLPYAGAAREVLKAAGHWDEFTGAGPEREFTVYLVARARAQACVIVKACSEAEADQKARHAAEGLWEYADDLYDVEAETILDSQS